MLYKFVGLGVMLAGLVWACIAMYRERKHRRRLLADRAVLSDEQVYAQFYAGSGLAEGDVIRAWREVADYLRVEAGRLRPGDELKTLRTNVWQPMSDLDDLHTKVLLARREAGGPEVLWTVDDVVRVLAADANIRADNPRASLSTGSWSMTSLKKPHPLEYAAFLGLAGVAVYVTIISHASPGSMLGIVWSLWVFLASQLTSFAWRLIRYRRARNRLGQGFPVIMRDEGQTKNRGLCDRQAGANQL